MFYLVGLLVIAALIGGFSASASLGLLRYRPAMAVRARRWLAALIGTGVTLSPAFVSAAQAGVGEVLSVLLGTALLAAVVGYPAVRVFEPKRARLPHDEPDHKLPEA